jgi:hypothetical protein
MSAQPSPSFARPELRIVIRSGKRVIQQRYSRFERTTEKGWEEISEWRDVPVVEEEKANVAVP